MKNKIIKALHLFLPIIIGFLVGWITKGNFNSQLYIQPPLFPPKIVFPIAWSIIYLFIGLSYMLYRYNYQNKETIIGYYQNLFLNFMWPILFFSLKLFLISTFWIIILDISTILLTKKYYAENKLSAYLLIPYNLWLGFATYLTIAFYILNF